MFIDQSVERPRGECPVGRPVPTTNVKFLCRWSPFQAVEYFQAFLHSKVTSWKDIDPAESEDQKHLGRPDADSSDGNEITDDLVIRFVLQSPERQAF